ncbi:MAG: DUF4979 domain-containing protein [Coprobacter sp.]|nr:DUF4979 domain-containing protein [Coprobacter sp.]
MKKLVYILLLAMTVMSPATQAQRKFTHPGITYTQGDIDRMKAMIAAKQEPFYGTFLKLKASKYSDLGTSLPNRGTQIAEGKFNGTIGADGRRALDLALLWHLTGDEAYAKKAVGYLNANSYYTNTSARGTGPLDNGKIYLLIDAAELMRDYPGWKAEDQQRFKDMLVYPYYTTKENLYEKYSSSDDSQNGITIYWNIFNGDPGRFGNQGLFAMRGLMAMGIYLDNDTIYDRAYRYLLDLPHRPDDLPYTPGPPIVSSEPTATSDYKYDYQLRGRENTIEDYGYDEQLQWYIHANGQCSEACRDQGHVLAGVHNYVAIAEIAWNQGDSLFSVLDNRILKGLEWAYRYNLSSIKTYPDQLSPWEPTGFTKDESEATFENGLFLQVKHRTGRWESINVSPDSRGDAAGIGGNREAALAHYAIRAGLPADDYKWLKRYRDYLIDNYGYEGAGVEPNWYYEWTGWGTLSKRRTLWMAGDPVTFASGERVSGIHKVPCDIAAVDYDYYCYNEDAEGHTYHNVGTTRSTIYRTDGAVEIAQVGDKYVVTDVEDGEWLHYTLAIDKTSKYDVVITYKADSEVTLAAAVDGYEAAEGTLPAGSELTTARLCVLDINAGAVVLRLSAIESGEGLQISNIRIEENNDKEVYASIEPRSDDVPYCYLSWYSTGFDIDKADILRGTTPYLAEAQVLVEGKTGLAHSDKTVDVKTPKYYYWLRYDTGNGITQYTDSLVFEWGYIHDTFLRADDALWEVTGQGTGVIEDGALVASYSSSKQAYFRRNTACTLHGGNYPILAFCMKRPEGATMRLNNPTYSFGNGTEKYTGKVGEDIYYYDLLSTGFGNATGIKAQVPADSILTVSALQIRETVPSASSAPTALYWVRTFRSVEELQTLYPVSSITNITPQATDIRYTIAGHTLTLIDMPSDATVYVYNTTGNIVVAQSTPAIQLPADGVYLVQVSSPDGIETIKINIKK